MIFAISYDIKDADRIQKLMDRINQLGDNIQFLSNSIFLQNNTNATAIYDDLRKITSDEDRILITRVDKGSIMGWLSTNAVNWIVSHG